MAKKDEKCFFLRVSPNTHAKVTALAKKVGLSVDTVLVTYLTQYLDPDGTFRKESAFVAAPTVKAKII